MCTICHVWRWGHKACCHRGNIVQMQTSFQYLKASKYLWHGYGSSKKKEMHILKKETQSLLLTSSFLFSSPHFPVRDRETGLAWKQGRTLVWTSFLKLRSLSRPHKLWEKTPGDLNSTHIKSQCWTQLNTFTGKPHAGEPTTEERDAAGPNSWTCKMRRWGGAGRMKRRKGGWCPDGGLMSWRRLDVLTEGWCPENQVTELSPSGRTQSEWTGEGSRKWVISAVGRVWERSFLRHTYTYTHTHTHTHT